MTKLLILSDSHNSTGAVERILHAENDATAVIFLGDGLRDLEEAPDALPENEGLCGGRNCDFGALEPLDGLAAFDQVVVFYTHGHMYGVNTIWIRSPMPPPPQGRGGPVRTHPYPGGRAARQGVLFNPGSCGRCYTGPNTYGVLTLDRGKIISHEHKEVPHP